MYIQTVTSNPPRYYYQCQEGQDTFICPAWQPVTNVTKASKIAICPYCKSNHLDALNPALPMVIH